MLLVTNKTNYMGICIWVAALLLLPKAGNAQVKTGPEIVTDRPTATPAPFVVPPNYIQAETGMGLRKENRGGSLNVPQALIRLGILPRTELRLTAPNYILLNGSGEIISGVNDMSVGMKGQLGPLPGKIQLAVIPGLTVPIGSASLTTNSVDPFVQITASRSLSKNWTIGSAHSIFVQTEAAQVQSENFTTQRRNAIYQPTFVVFRKITPKADLFFEYVGNFTKGKLSDQILDAGSVYRYCRNQQIGIRGGVGLTTASPTVFVELGYSFLLGKIIR